MLRQLISAINYQWSSRISQRLTLTPLFSMTACSRQASTSNYRNRLAHEKSPYLLQHASNPVQWYPWGQEAFDKAKQENKPIFLSVGYSTCHWCHVMERESFVDEEIGEILNDNFVSIKVDREERPDVDKVYMEFIHATCGGGGWPMSVWLTPDLKPIVGGTYFPPDNRYRDRPGFKSVIRQISNKWKEDQAGVESQGAHILNVLMEHHASSLHADSALPSPKIIEDCYRKLLRGYDSVKGGFGKAPKFPQPVNINFMFRVYGQSPQSERGLAARDMCRHTLLMMAKGGMWDHVAKGFHRYSTDSDWHVPHFEKMLYDQSQLAAIYSLGYQVTGEEKLAVVAREILEYVSRDLSHKDGGFYSAEDADSFPTHRARSKKEGAFCVWTKKDILRSLRSPLGGDSAKTEGDVFCHHYDVHAKGNVDPAMDLHNELEGQNVLIERGDVQMTADTFGLTPDKVLTILTQGKAKLYDVRKGRPPPHLDNKMVTAWNGLMISGFAKAAQIIGDQTYTERALSAVEFCRSHLYDPESGTLYRSCYVGQDGGVTQISPPIQGFADDYAYMIRGLLDTYEACFNEDLLQWAEKLQLKMDELFYDEEEGCYFNSSHNDTSIVLRIKEDQDGAEPSANSITAGNLLRLATLVNVPKWRDQTERIFIAFHERLETIPLALPEMVSAYMSYQRAPIQVIIAGDRDADDTQELLRCVHAHYLPDKTLILTDGRTDGYLYGRLPILSTITRNKGKATAYVCDDFTCSLPTNTLEGLCNLLEKRK